jgi:hypothetical protein
MAALRFFTYRRSVPWWRWVTVMGLDSGGRLRSGIRHDHDKWIATREARK